jgi:hypothetical protein
LPLVEKDRLFFTLSPPSGPELSTPAAVKPELQTFRLGFNRIWAQIPAGGRASLLCYWRQPLPGGHLPAPHTRPLIRVVDVLPGSSSSPVDRLGNEFNFPFSLVAENPQGLPAVIARALAVASLYATRRHWALAVELIEDPLERWSRRQGKNADDATRDAKIDRLEAAHLRAYKAEVAGVLRAWGFGGPEGKAGKTSRRSTTA